MSGISILGTRIAKLRRAKAYTQEELSRLLHVTPQAVSRWELGQTCPEISLLPEIAKIFEISLDQLLTGNSFIEKISPYDAFYQEAEYYWGLKQSELAERVVRLVKERGIQDPALLEIGSGEGRDAVYFAKCGFGVDALEISSPGIGKVREYSRLAGCEVQAIEKNMIGYMPKRKYDGVYSMGTLQFLPPERREEHFAYYKASTRKGGFNAYLVFVHKPFIETAPDWQENEFFYWSGDLAGYYRDWNILFQEEKILDCNSSGVGHQHAVCSIIAKK